MMMTRHSIEAQARTVVGKKVKSLRRTGVLPANLYGHGIQSQSLQLDAHRFSLLQRHVSASALIDLSVDGATRPVMIHRVQRDVRTGMPTHVEFFQVNPKERLTATVPLVLIGEPDLVRRGEAVLLHDVTSVEVTCLPDDLPALIEVPTAALAAVGDSIHAGDLAYDRAKITLKTPAEERIASLVAPQIYVEEEAPVTEAAPETAEEAAGEEAEAEE
jgi:large subunit ribosomal protein L25